MIKKLADKALYKKCLLYGKQALQARRKFMGLLPEVCRRRLYEKKGFASIFEFAAKLAGLSHDQVARAINLERKFESAPALKELLVSGQASINKLARVASIATPQNQQALAEQVKILPQKALETLVRDERKIKEQNDLRSASSGADGQLQLENQNKNAFQKPLFACETVRAHKLELAPDVENELYELQQKGININNLLRKFLQKRKEEIGEKKQQLAKEEAEKLKAAKTHAESAAIPSSRHISIKIRKILQLEHGSKCSIPTCTKPASKIHHLQRFALTSLHDPHYLAPLCREHHIIAHSIDEKYQTFKEI